MKELMVVMMHWAIFFLVEVPAKDISTASFHHSSVPILLPYSSKLDNILEPMHVCLRRRVERCYGHTNVENPGPHALCVITQFRSCLAEPNIYKNPDLPFYQKV